MVQTQCGYCGEQAMSSREEGEAVVVTQELRKCSVVVVLDKYGHCGASLSELYAADNTHSNMS